MVRCAGQQSRHGRPLPAQRNRVPVLPSGVWQRQIAGHFHLGGAALPGIPRRCGISPCSFVGLCVFIPALTAPCVLETPTTQCWNVAGNLGSVCDLANALRTPHSLEDLVLRIVLAVDFGSALVSLFLVLCLSHLFSAMLRGFRPPCVLGVPPFIPF